MATQDANTVVPKFLQGSTITITKADGSKEIVKSEDYMVVKRKHPRPVMVHVTNNTTSCTEYEVTNIVPEDQKYSKNILSLKVVDGYSDVDVDRNPLQTKLSIDRRVGAGIMYQRAYNNRFYFGVEADSNQGAGIMGGVGF